MTWVHTVKQIGAIALGGAIISGCAVLKPIGKISVEDFTAPQAALRASGLDAAQPLQITAFVTGWVEAPADILIDQDADNLPDALKNDQWVPALAYAVRHPTLGVVIFDTGLRAGACDYGLRPLYWVTCRNQVGSDLVSQLKVAEIGPDDIRYIIPSHFHGDHVSGLESLLAYADVPVLMTTEALDALRSPMRFAAGVVPSMLRADMRAAMIDPHWRVDAELGNSFDLFGDGSLMIFTTTGHTDGHVSALVKVDSGPVLLTFDAAHLKANFDLGIPSGAVSSHDEALKSLRSLQDLSEAQPDMAIIYGHEPAQWDCTVGYSPQTIGAHLPCG